MQTVSQIVFGRVLYERSVESTCLYLDKEQYFFTEIYRDLLAVAMMKKGVHKKAGIGGNTITQTIK